MMIKEKTYKAFISYSHADEKFGKWLHRALEKYKTPKELRKDYPNLPKSLFPIFRDREELSTSSDLGIEILKALRNSEYFIIICSINSAKSKWVNQEIIDFKRIHGEDKVHAIIINGEPHAKESNKFDDNLECFPEALKYKVVNGKLSNIPTEPIAGDFRKGKDGKEYGRLKLISGLLGVGFDELNRREERRKRRNRLIWGTFITIFVSLISSFFVYISMIKSSLIDVKAEIAELKLYIKSVDSQENNKTVVILNKKLKVLLEIKREKEEILDGFGLLEKDKKIVPTNQIKIKDKLDNFKLIDKIVSDNQIKIKSKLNEIDIKIKKKSIKEIIEKNNIFSNLDFNEDFISEKKMKQESNEIIHIPSSKIYNKPSDFIITDIQGDKIHINEINDGLIFEEYKGKVIFLVLFGYACPPCNMEILDLIELTKKYSDKLTIIAIEVQGYSKDDLKIFKSKKNINYFLFQGEENKSFLRYIVEKSNWKGAIPFFIAFNKDGKVKDIVLGFISKNRFEILIKKLSIDCNTTI